MQKKNDQPKLIVLMAQHPYFDTTPAFETQCSSNVILLEFR